MNRIVSVSKVELPPFRQLCVCVSERASREEIEFQILATLDALCPPFFPFNRHFFNRSHFPPPSSGGPVIFQRSSTQSRNPLNLLSFAPWSSRSEPCQRSCKFNNSPTDFSLDGWNEVAQKHRWLFNCPAWVLSGLTFSRNLVFLIWPRLFEGGCGVCLVS